MHRSPTPLPLLAGTIKPAVCTLTASHCVPNSHLFVLHFACLYLYDTLPALDYSVDCLTTPKPEPSRPCLYVCMSMIERGKIRERATGCVTYHIAKRGEQSKAMCSEDGRTTERFDRWVAKCEENVPWCHPQFLGRSKVRYITKQPEVYPLAPHSRLIPTRIQLRLSGLR